MTLHKNQELPNNHFRKVFPRITESNIRTGNAVSGLGSINQLGSNVVAMLGLNGLLLLRHVPQLSYVLLSVVQD
jgi:hypothetical protein